MRKHRRVAVIAAFLVVVLMSVQAVSASAQSDTKPTATEVGVTADTIRIGVVADNDNPFVPGIFKGAADAVVGFAKYINANGGIAGRKLVVDVYDSKLNANETRNTLIQACSDDFALVGTTALFVTTFEDVQNCKDSKGQATGIPDIGGLITSLTEACAPVTYSPNAPQVQCDTVGKDPIVFQGTMGPFKYYVDKLKNNAHGALLKSNDTPDSRRSGEANLLLTKKAGVKPDVEAALSSRDPQSAYTPIVAEMKSKNSNFSYLAMSLNSAIQLRQEAALQGIDANKVVWLCPSPCYDQEGMSAAGSTMNGEQVFLTFLPFEEAKYNKTLAAYLKYTGKDKADGFGVSAWAAAKLFQQALTDVVKKKGVNGATRANLFSELNATGQFNADGMVSGANISTKTGSPCYLLLNYTNGKYTRVHPTKKGTFDCTKSNYTTVEGSGSG